MSVNTGLAQLLRDAAQYLNEHGHCTGVMQTTDGRVCALGAVVNASREQGLSADLEIGAVNALYAHIGGSITEWNDHGWGRDGNDLDKPPSSLDIQKTFLQIADNLEFADQQ